MGKTAEVITEEALRRAEVVSAVNDELVRTDNGCHQPLGPIIALLRLSSRMMENPASISKSNQQLLLFPGWDYDGVNTETINRTNRIREVAIAILGRAHPDVGSSVPMKDVGELIHYIADMMEA